MLLNVNPMYSSLSVFILFLLSLLHVNWAIDLNVTDKASICNATSLIQQGMMDYYLGIRYGGTVGMFQPPYYWWEAGEAFGGMLENWFLCQNDTYKSILMDAFVAQTGPEYNYMPTNQTMVEGNDDQCIWGLTIMDAVERNFTAPDKEGVPGWLALTQAVFNTMWSRWDETHCNGGLRWQIFTWNSGYNYKNTISNGCLFQLAARLGRYTTNTTYLEVASTVFDWLTDVGFVVIDGQDKGNVYDGASIEDNCTDITTLEWSYNHGIVLGGAAFMYNATNGSTVWQNRVNKLLSGAVSYFFQDGIMYESACQDSHTCNTDQRSFKSIFSRMLSFTSMLVPETAPTIDALMKTTAEAAALSCSGGTDGHTCGLDWQLKKWDGMYGLGEQMCALEAIQSQLIHDRPALYTKYTGGSSKGDVNAGLDSSSADVLQNKLKITSGDRAGAAIITAIILAVLLGGAVWMIF